MDQWRPVELGILATAIVRGVGHLESVVRDRIPGCFLEQGDASCALYLFHTLLIPAVVAALLRARVADPAAALVICCGASLLVSLAIHKLIERPLNRMRKLRRMAATLGAASPG